LRADSQHVFKTESGELRFERGVFRVVDFVYDKNDRLINATKLLRQILVDRRESRLRVDYEQNDVGGLHRDVHLRANLLRKRRVHDAADAAGIDDREWLFAELALGGKPVARDAGLIVDDRNFSSGKPVEDRGFSDVRPPDDGDSSSWHGLPPAIDECRSSRSRCRKLM